MKRMQNQLIISSMYLFAMLLMTACGPKKPNVDEPEEEEWNINGGDSDQPIMDGWTYEMAAEYYMQGELDFDYGR